MHDQESSAVMDVSPQTVNWFSFHTEIIYFMLLRTFLTSFQLSILCSLLFSALRDNT